MNPLISVIIPVYNVGPYLAEALESVLAQTYNNLEIIVVNDGSTDNSLEIINDYSTRDKRIRVISQKNSGLSEARNKGVEAASGEWCFFLDSDDWLDSDSLHSLLCFASKHNCDIVQGNLYYAYNDYLLWRKPSGKERNRPLLTKEEAIRQLILNDRIKNFAWGKLYRMELIKDLKFPKGKYFEDSFWQHQAVHKCEKYGIIDTPLYYYRQRPEGISGTVSNRRKDLLEGYKARRDFIIIHYPQYKKIMNKKYRQVYNQIERADKMRYSPMSLLKRLCNRIFNRYERLDISHC